MHNGFKKLALGITGVALLSGKTLATGPTVETPADLIITDRLPAGAVLDGAGPWDDGTPTGTNSGTLNIYDFTGALTLSDIVDAPLAPNGLQDVVWDFAELDGPGGSVLGSGTTIRIDDGTNAAQGASAEPTFSDLGSSSFDNVAGSAPLDFRNVPRTTSTGPAVPTFLDETTIKLYFATLGDPTESVASTEFNVYTTNDITVSNGDDFSLPSSVFTPVEAFSDFEGWYQTARLDQGVVFDTGPVGGAANYVAPLQFSANVGDLPNSVPAIGSLVSTPDEFGAGSTFLTIPAATDTFTVQTDTGSGGISFNRANNQYPQLLGFGSFFEGIPSTANDFVNVTADELYMVRWNLSTPTDIADVEQLPLAQLIVGETGSFGVGRSLLSFDGNNLNNLAGSSIAFRQYFYAHDAGEIGFFINVFDSVSAGAPGFPAGHTGHDVSVESVEVFTVNTAGLTGENVVFNQGQTSVPLVSGEPAPPSTGLEEFDLNFWYGRDQFAFIADNTGDAADSRNASFTPNTPFVGVGQPYTAPNTTASTLSYTLGQGDGPAFIIWDTLGSSQIDSSSGDPTIANPREVLTAPEGTLVVMDYWLSATGSTAQLPFTRVGMASQNIYPTSTSITATDPIQGYAAYMEFNPDSTADGLANGTSVNPAIGFQAGSARRARLVWEVQLTSTATDSGTYAFRPTVESFVIPAGVSGGGASQANGTINIHRVVVTTFDKPAGAETTTVPASLTDL